MRLLLLVLAISFSAGAAVKKFNFFYSGIEGRNRVYLSCDYAEYQLEKFLTQIGGEKIDVRCSGGIQNGWVSPVSLYSTYEIKDIDMSGEELAIKSDFNSDCFFDTKLLNQLLDKQDHLEVTNSRSGCFRNDSRYFFNINFL